MRRDRNVGINNLTPEAHRPAFPGARSDFPWYNGLTKREYIATQIAAGLRKSGFKAQDRYDFPVHEGLANSEEIAKQAIEDTDALLKELNNET